MNEQFTGFDTYEQIDHLRRTLDQMATDLNQMATDLNQMANFAEVGIDPSDDDLVLTRGQLREYVSNMWFLNRPELTGVIDARHLIPHTFEWAQYIDRNSDEILFTRLKHIDDIHLSSEYPEGKYPSVYFGISDYRYMVGEYGCPAGFEVTARSMPVSWEDRTAKDWVIVDKRYLTELVLSMESRRLNK